MSLKLVPIESLGTVSYSPSTITVTVSVAVCDIFSVKELCDLENRVRVCSRSFEMAPFDRIRISEHTHCSLMLLEFRSLLSGRLSVHVHVATV